MMVKDPCVLGVVKPELREAYGKNTSPLATATLDEDVEHLAILIDCAP